MKEVKENNNMTKHNQTPINLSLIILTILIISGVVWGAQKSERSLPANNDNTPALVGEDNTENKKVIVSDIKTPQSPNEIKNLIMSINIDGTPDELGWLTYTNKLHGFEMKYPKEFFVDEYNNLKFNTPQGFSENLPVLSLSTRIEFIKNFSKDENTPWLSLNYILEEQKKIKEDRFDNNEIPFESINGVKGFTEYKCLWVNGFEIDSNSIFFTPSSRVEMGITYTRSEWQFKDKQTKVDFAMKNCERLVTEEIENKQGDDMVKKIYLIRDKVLESISLIQYDGSENKEDNKQKYEIDLSSDVDTSDWVLRDHGLHGFNFYLPKEFALIKENDGVKQSKALPYEVVYKNKIINSGQEITINSWPRYIRTKSGEFFDRKEVLIAQKLESDNMFDREILRGGIPGNQEWIYLYNNQMIVSMFFMNIGDDSRDTIVSNFEFTEDKNMDRINEYISYLDFCEPVPYVVEDGAWGGHTFYKGIVNPQYHNVRGLAELFTADDCGPERLEYYIKYSSTEYENPLQTVQTGLLMSLKEDHTQSFVELLESLKLKPSEDCSEKRGSCYVLQPNTKTNLKSLLQIKPYTNQIKNISCVDCGG